MTTAKFAALTQAPAATAAQPLTAPTMIDPSLFKLVSGGSPKGGWAVEPTIVPENPPAPAVG